MTTTNKEKLMRSRYRAVKRIKFFEEKNAPGEIIEHANNVLARIVVDCKQSGITDNEYKAYCREQEKGQDDE